MIQIFQNPKFGEFLGYRQDPDGDPEFPKLADCTKVATIDTNNLEDAYGRSQHPPIEGGWLIGAGVTPEPGRTGRNTRSCAVGDLFVQEDGSVHVIAAWEIWPTGEVAGVPVS